MSLPSVFCGPEGHFQCHVAEVLGEALSSLSLPEDAVTCPTEQGWLLHSPENIKCSQKHLIIMLTLEIYTDVGIAVPCAGQDGLPTPSQGALLMVHGVTEHSQRQEGAAMQTDPVLWP